MKSSKFFLQNWRMYIGKAGGILKVLGAELKKKSSQALL